MKAFEVLDQDNKGYLTTEEMTKFMSEEGECFSKVQIRILRLYSFTEKIHSFSHLILPVSPGVLNSCLYSMSIFTYESEDITSISAPSTT